MATAKIGDILEIATDKGRAYAQYTHENKLMGGLIRVFDAIHDSRQTDIADLVRGTVRFSTFLPVRQVVKQKIFLVVGNADITPENQMFPLFRAGAVNPKTRKVDQWWLWDGEKEWPIGSLTAEQRRLPIRGCWNDTFLIDRIEEGWTPEKDNL